MDIMSKHFWKEGPGSFLVAIGIALFIRWSVLEAYVIPSGSMLPSLLINDHIFVNKFVYGLRYPFTEKWMFRVNNPTKGEVIVFKYPENIDIFYIKRVVGTEGDRIFYENGNLYVNNEIVERKVPGKLKTEFDWLNDTVLHGEGPQARDNYTHWEENLGEHNYSTLLRKGERMNNTFGPITVPKDSYFVMGDNRDNSKDSRFWDPERMFVPHNYLVGRAAFVWLSCDSKIPVVGVLCNPTTIRWKRFFHFVHD